VEFQEPEEALPQEEESASALEQETGEEQVEVGRVSSQHGKRQRE
jgi:hypothetical protein